MPATHRAQTDFDFNIEKPDWMALRVLIWQLEQELADRRRHVLRRVSNWFMALDLFAKFEEKHIVEVDPSPRDLEYHRVFLTQLLAQGESLLLELQRASDVDPANIGIKADDLMANVAYLRDKYSRSYQSVTSERANAVLQEVFGGEMR